MAISNKLKEVIERAVRIGHVKNGLVTCDNCDNPADRDLAESMSWVPCGPCCFGEANSLDPERFLSVKELNAA